MAQQFGLPQPGARPTRVAGDARRHGAAHEASAFPTSRWPGRSQRTRPSKDRPARSTATISARSCGPTTSTRTTTFRADRRDEIRQQITQSLVGGATVPEAYLQAFKEYNGEERSVSFLILPVSVAGDVGSPSDADLTKFFEANKASWKAPEYRALSLVKLTPADIAKPDEVTDEEAKKVYDASVATYTTAEQRKISQIVFADQADADKAAASLAAGLTFDDLATERNLKAGGCRSRSRHARSLRRRHGRRGCVYPWRRRGQCDHQRPVRSGHPARRRRSSRRS